MSKSLKVIAFPGAPNLPLFAARELGFFGEAGLDVLVETTPSSVHQFEQFGAGAYDIAFTAFDNVVAYREGQGAAKLADTSDFRVLLGATQIELSLIVAPDIREPRDLIGKSLALDAVSTGFAFVLYDMLDRWGLKKDDYSFAAVGATPERWQSVKAGTHAGTITIEPFTSIARAAGFHVLEKSTNVLPAYQGGIVAARQNWAKANTETVVAFLRAYLRGLEWTLAPQNRERASELLQKNMPEVKPNFISVVMDSLLSPRSGLTPNGAILEAGMLTVLDLRSRYGKPPKTLSDLQRYLDLSFYQAALAS